MTPDKAAASRRWPVITALGLTQIMAWGSSYYLPAVLAQPIASDTGWPLGWVVGGLSLGLIAAGAVSPFVGQMIASRGGRPDELSGRLVAEWRSVAKRSVM